MQQEQKTSRGKWPSLDLRSLALFRILLGILLLADLLYRCADFSVFYADGGILPPGLDALHSKSFIHGLSNSTIWQVLVVAMQGIAIICVVVGYHTKVALAACWALLASLNHRNPWILQIADRVYIYWIVYALLLPTHLRFSLDRRRLDKASQDATQTGSIVSLLLLLQVVGIYEIAASYKAFTETWRTGSILIEAMRTDAVATDLGRSLLAFPGLLKFAGQATLVFEFVGPILLLCTWKRGMPRTILCFAFVSFHLFGIGLMMKLGLVGGALAVVWFALLPGWFWDVLLPKCGIHRFQSDRPKSVPNQSWSRVTSVVVCTIWVISWSTTLARATPRFQVPHVLQYLLSATGLAQDKFSLWTDPGGSRRFVFAATLANGRQIDLHTGRDLDWTSPRQCPKNNHWYKCFQKLRRDERVAENVARYFINEWNEGKSEDERVVKMEIVILLERKQPASFWLNAEDPKTIEVPSVKLKAGRFDVFYSNDGTRLIRE
ncbi:MAG: hypothetical protein AB7S38_15550 [Vulcanimicrobiota bacterium]